MICWATTKYLKLRSRCLLAGALVALGVLTLLAAWGEHRNPFLGWPLLALSAVGFAELLRAAVDRSIVTRILDQTSAEELDDCAPDVIQRLEQRQPRLPQDFFIAFGAGLIVSGQLLAVIWMTFFNHLAFSDDINFIWVGTLLTLPLLIPVAPGLWPFTRRRAAVVGVVWLLVGLFPLWIFLAFWGLVAALPAGLLALVGALAGRNPEPEGNRL